MDSNLHEHARRIAPQLVEWRRRLHRHPELGFEEHETSAFVQARLRELHLEVTGGMAKTGVVAVVRRGSGAADAVLLRADMDALPIQEKPGRPYGSEFAGRMHACGHDGHTAMLLGAATLLAARRGKLRRDVVLCFQPAEEGLGGAKAMIEAGVLDLAPVRRAYALHLWTPFPAGTVHVRSGPTMAAQDEFTATVRGRGGHGAFPHAARDPIVAACSGVSALQTVISRRTDPTEVAVATVGSFHAGTAPNVIPDSAVLIGTLRSFREEVREALRTQVHDALEGSARAVGCTLEFDLRAGYPAVVNDPGAVERLRAAAVRVVGPGGVGEHPPMAASEDFAYFLEKVPGAFAFLGAGNAERGITAPNHSPEFDLDEDVLPLGAELLARLALEPVPSPRNAK